MTGKKNCTSPKCPKCNEITYLFSNRFIKKEKMCYYCEFCGVLFVPNSIKIISGVKLFRGMKTIDLGVK